MKLKDYEDNLKELRNEFSQGLPPPSTFTVFRMMGAQNIDCRHPLQRYMRPETLTRSGLQLV